MMGWPGKQYVYQAKYPNGHGSPDAVIANAGGTRWKFHVFYDVLWIANDKSKCEDV